MESEISNALGGIIMTMCIIYVVKLVFAFMFSDSAWHRDK